MLPPNLAAAKIVFNMNVYQKMLRLISYTYRREIDPRECPGYFPQNSQQPTRKKSK